MAGRGRIPPPPAPAGAAPAAQIAQDTAGAAPEGRRRCQAQEGFCRHRRAGAPAFQTRFVSIGGRGRHQALGLPGDGADRCRKNLDCPAGHHAPAQKKRQRLVRVTPKSPFQCQICGVLGDLRCRSGRHPDRRPQGKCRSSGDRRDDRNPAQPSLRRHAPGRKSEDRPGDPGRGPFPRRPGPRGGVGGNHDLPPRPHSAAAALGHHRQCRPDRGLAGRHARPQVCRRGRNAAPGAALSAVLPPFGHPAALCRLHRFRRQAPAVPQGKRIREHPPSAAHRPPGPAAALRRNARRPEEIRPAAGHLLSEITGRLRPGAGPVPGIRSAKRRSTRSPQPPHPRAGRRQSAHRASSPAPVPGAPGGRLPSQRPAAGLEAGIGVVDVGRPARCGFRHQHGRGRRQFPGPHGGLL